MNAEEVRKLINAGTAIPGGGGRTDSRSSSRRLQRKSAGKKPVKKKRPNGKPTAKSSEKDRGVTKARKAGRDEKELISGQTFFPFCRCVVGGPF